LELNYEIFSSKKNRIEFQYPKGWTCEEIPPNDEMSPTFIQTKSPDSSKGILIIYGPHLMSAFGTSLFPGGLYEAFNSSTGYGTNNDAEVIEKPHPVQIDGQKAAGTFVIRYNNHSPPIITQTWIVYLGIVTNSQFDIGEYGYKIMYRSEDFYNLENIEIREQLLKGIKFLCDRE